MNIDVQNKIKTDPNLKRYLRENSIWYKKLNRNPLLINDMIENMKEDYKLRPSDRLNNIINTVDIIENFMKNMDS